jgi:hypothetical protein
MGRAEKGISFKRSGHVIRIKLVVCSAIGSFCILLLSP